MPTATPDRIFRRPVKTYVFSVVGISRCDVRAACRGATPSNASAARLCVPPATTRAGTAQRAIPAIALNTYVKTLALVSLLFGSWAAALAAPEESPQGASRRDEADRRVFKDRIAPHWFHDNTRFWYRNNLRGGTKEFIVVDAIRGTRELAFDHAKLASGLSKAAGAEHAADKLPFDSIEFIDDDKAIRFNVGDEGWKCALNSYECSRTDAKASAASSSETNSAAEGEPRTRRGRDQRPRESSDRSPDGKWIASVKDYNVFIRSRDQEKEIQLSTDGKEGLAYGRLSWAPDS